MRNLENTDQVDHRVKNHRVVMANRQNEHITSPQIDSIIRSRRKTIAFHITEDAKLIVKAPFYVTDKSILAVLKKHEKWVIEKQNEMKHRISGYLPKKFVDKEDGYLYLGINYKLNIVEKQTVPLKFDDGFYLARWALPDARQRFIAWYRKKAIEVIHGRVIHYARQMGLHFSKISITGAQKRWGSCSSRGNLSFSWRLVMADLNVIDYVVIHELVHLIEHNHSRCFWDKIEEIIPDYEKHQDWLKSNGYLMKI